MKINNRFFDQRIAVLGFGIEGQSAADFFIEQGAYVAVWDAKSAESFDTDVRAKYEEAGILFDCGSARLGGEFDFAVRSPGISVHAAVLVDLRARGVRITSATQIFFDECSGRTIGITGTKGKGTTSTLIYELLRAAGVPTVLGGNIGTPMLSLLPQITDDTIAVLELSSFQLQDLTRSPHIAVVLMTTSDHLDVHADEAEYVAAKAAITKFQTEHDVLVVNSDYPNSRAIAESSLAQRVFVSAHERVDGCYADDESVVWTGEGENEIIAATSDVVLPGRHNLENVCAAVAVAKMLHISDECIVGVLRAFHGLEHRLELVREVRGVRYYNDSFATNPASTIAAIRAFDAPKILILGGSPKGTDFSELATVIVESNIRAIVGIGEEWLRIKAALEDAGARGIIYLEGCTTAPEMVAAAARVAEHGDVVLMSPACASFGLFNNYKERGYLFKDAVLHL